MKTAGIVAVLESRGRKRRTYAHSTATKSAVFGFLPLNQLEDHGSVLPLLIPTYARAVALAGRFES